jgi:mono/diheme cytochrome c family protein
MKIAVRLLVGLAFLMSAHVAMAQKGDAKAGKEPFGRTCAMCHGPDGNTPNAALAKMLKVEKIPQLGSSEIQAKTDDELKKVIMEGFGKMKPVSTLSEKDVRNVIAFVRTIKKP